MYRARPAREATVVYDTWRRQGRKVAQLAKRDAVEAVNGVVITYRPGVIKTSEGGATLTCPYRGEGYSEAWLRWAEVRLKAGHIGWVNMNRAEFDGTRAIAK